MPRPRSKWAPPWKEVAAELRNELGGTWPQVLEAIEAETPGVLARWVSGDGLKDPDRRNLAQRQMGTWASRGTAPDRIVAPSVVSLLADRLTRYTWLDEVDGHTYTAAEILRLRLSEAGQPVLFLNETPPRPAERRGPLLAFNGNHRFPQVSQSKLSLGATRGSGLVGTGGSAIGVREGNALRVARVNRVSGRTAEWMSPLDLPELGQGSVLAIDGCGPADIVFVWASDTGTAIYRGDREGGSGELVQRLDDKCASAAVLHGVRALLSFPDSTPADGMTCEAFPELILTSVVGAASNGRLVVLAVGEDRDEQESAWIEVDGRYRQIVPAGAILELPLGTRSFPILRGADGSVIEVSPRPTSAQPYEHWASPFLIGQAATA